MNRRQRVDPDRAGRLLKSDSIRTKRFFQPPFLDEIHLFLCKEKIFAEMEGNTTDNW